MARYKEISGQHFGRLIALRYVGSKRGRARWLCKCDCGCEAIVVGGNLQSSVTKSCGCLQRERLRKRVSTLNGLCVTYKKEYDVWRKMCQRCHNPDTRSYEDYGLEGIKVCGRWKGTDGFKNFMEDMGERPEGNYQIDRLDSDYGYTPWNCKWVTSRENALNRSTTHWIEHGGFCLCIRDWERVLGMNKNVLSRRINQQGRSIESALTTPVQKRK